MKEENYRSAVECYTKAIDLDLRNAVYYCNRYLKLHVLCVWAAVYIYRIINSVQAFYNVTMIQHLPNKL